MQAPFKRFIITLLFFNQSIADVSKRLSTFGYSITDEEIASIFADIKAVIPQSIKDILNARTLVDMANPEHEQWLRYFGIFEFYHYTVATAAKKDEKQDYFKWCEDCLWIHKYKDAMTLTNIFLFNGEDMESISDVLMYKMRRKIGLDALKLYQRMFWECGDMTAKDAYTYCVPFRGNSVIVRNLRSGEVEVESGKADESCNGLDVPLTFHDSAYIKWKIGYRKIKAPDAKSFLEAVKVDSMFKYYEAMNMARSVVYEEEESEGNNDKLGAFDSTLKRYKFQNVEEQRAKLARSWLNMYMQAEKSIPNGSGDASKDFFQQMQQISLSFKDEEKIIPAEQVPNLFEDIRGDM